MASGPPNGLPQVQFYPAYCHKASPTYFTWVKLTASDIHYALRKRPGFDQFNHGQARTHLLFYLNHPIQFVCIVGVITAFDEYLDYCWLFTIDDSSGATIDVTCRKPPKGQNPKDRDEDNIAGQDERSWQPAAPTLRTDKDKEGLGGSDNGEDTRNTMISRIDLGTVVKVKGTISTFRNVRQIQLERLTLISDTSEEMRFWDQRSQLLADVLSEPWAMLPEKQKKLRREAEGETEYSKGRVARHNERAAKRQRREERDAEKIAKAYEAEETDRVKEAGEAKEWGMLLRADAEEKPHEEFTTHATREGHLLGAKATKYADDQSPRRAQDKRTA